jgi:hypothetical protein
MDGRDHSIVVRNLSQKGLGAKIQGRPPSQGEDVVIRFEGREMVGRVRWVKGVRFGIQLRDAIRAQDHPVAPPWPEAKTPSPGFHVFDRFKPVARPWRPGVLPN